jgi:hypothetical protein
MAGIYNRLVTYLVYVYKNPYDKKYPRKSTQQPRKQEGPGRRVNGEIQFKISGQRHTEKDQQITIV